MANEVKRADVSALVTKYNTIRSSVTFTQGAAGGTGTLTVNVTNLNNPIPEKITLTSLKGCIDDLFTKFSENCNCAENLQCNQSCQEITCESECVIAGNQAQCNATSNQGCQTTTCQANQVSANQAPLYHNQACQVNQACQGNQSNQGQCYDCANCGP